MEVEEVPKLDVVKPAHPGLITPEDVARIEVRELEKRLLDKLENVADRVEMVSGNLADMTHELKQVSRDLTQTQANYISRSVYEAKHQAIEERMFRMEKWRAWVMGLAFGLSIIGGYIGAELMHLVK